METNELRIGNWISLGNRIGYIQSIWSKTQYIVIDEEETQDTIESIERFKPIELTEEWLIRFGFNDIEDKLYCKRWRLNRVDIYKMISGNYPFYFRFNQVDSKIKYVHQLQNLYFALTDKELTIK